MSGQLLQAVVKHVGLASRLIGWEWDSFFGLFFLLFICLFVGFFFCFLPACCLGGSGIVCFICLFGLLVCLFVCFSTSRHQVAWVRVG